MIVLGVDTTGAQCAVALRRDGDVLAHDAQRIGRGHAEALGPMVERVLAEASIAPTDIDRVCVCTGPGSFTGLRVGLAFAIGFALPRNLPVIGFDTLTIAAPETGRVVITQDVRRGQLAFAAYETGQLIHPFTVADVDTALATIADLKADKRIDDPVPDMARATHLALTADPARWPARALYARAPDAKLPGGLDPAKL